MDEAGELRGTQKVGRRTAKMSPQLDQCMNDDWQDVQFYPNGVPFHPGGYYGVRSKLTPGGHSNQCIYDENGNLLTSASGAGSADYRGFEGLLDRGPHYWHDVDPFFEAQRLDRIDDYYEVRPSVNQ